MKIRRRHRSRHYRRARNAAVRAERRRQAGEIDRLRLLNAAFVRGVRSRVAEALAIVGGLCGP